MLQPLPLNKKKIMIVDDARPPRKVLKKLLSEFGSITFYEAETIQQAKEILNKEEINIVFCDHNLPDANSHALLSWLKNQTKQVPTIVISSDLKKETVIEGKKLGALNFLVKPFNFGDLSLILSSSFSWDEQTLNYFQKK